jgi:predicted nucleic acid-binding protein
MAMSDELALVDTNVLVEATFSGTAHHAAARAIVERAKERTGAMCVLPQIVAEFYSIVTDARRVKPVKTPAEALAAIDAYLSLPGMTLLPVPADVVSRLTELLRRRPVRGPEVYDVQLVAGMLGNGIRRIYTFNRDDFTPFDELEVLDS